MITGYEIKKINNQEVLYLHLRFDLEFATLNKSKQNKKLQQEIKDYIKTNKINFVGSQIVLMLGGLMLGSVILNNSGKTESDFITPFNTNNITLLSKVDEVYIPTKITPEEKLETVLHQEKEETNMKENNQDLSSGKIDNSKETVKIEESKDTTIIEEKKIVEEDKTYVTLKRSSGIMETIELEEYLIGVVAAEMPALFLDEALKSQAIVARTYTLKLITRGEILTDTVRTQSYKDQEDLKKLWKDSFSKYYQKIASAVKATKGLYLTYNGEIIEAVYHSTSNGTTEDAKNVWGKSYPYLVSVESKYDSENKEITTTTFLTYEEISKRLGFTVDFKTTISLDGTTEGNRISRVQVANKTYSGHEFRTKLGLRSADLAIEKTEAGINFTTNGYGHGVGMSQYCANGMAKAGSNYVEILLHYYPGVKITKLS